MKVKDLNYFSYLHKRQQDILGTRRMQWTIILQCRRCRRYFGQLTNDNNLSDLEFRKKVYGTNRYKCKYCPQQGDTYRFKIICIEDPQKAKDKVIKLNGTKVEKLW